ncbi:alpha/beta hydrolase [Speluncibacter jeojiensis]|uniref:alpha/beta hydrolase n=1 Tax=Speluncibacter jeojiensis TaxID=2710754 RepID=UPI0038CDC972
MPRKKTRTMSRLSARAAAAAAIVVLPLLGAGYTASADPVTADTAATVQARAVKSSDGSYLQQVQQVDGRQMNLYVYSAAMEKIIQLEVITPADTSAPRPTLYLLNGAGGGEDSATWQAQTDIVNFFKDKNVNVVTPVGGAFSYYTDWQKTDPVLGKNMWTTFLTEEAPSIVNSALNTNGVNSIAALSMSGSSVLSLAEHAPDLYKSVGAYSGCAETSTQPGQDYVKLVVASRGGGDVTNMWGPVGGPDWKANDAYVNIDKLKGKNIALWITSGSGLPGPHDNLNGPGINGSVPTLANQIIVGGVIEAAVNQCTHELATKMAKLQIPAHFDFKPTGTHSWGYWQDDLHQSWPMIAKSMNI